MSWRCPYAHQLSEKQLGEVEAQLETDPPLPLWSNGAFLLLEDPIKAALRARRWGGYWRPCLHCGKAHDIRDDCDCCAAGKCGPPIEERDIVAEYKARAEQIKQRRAEAEQLRRQIEAW